MVDANDLLDKGREIDRHKNQKIPTFDFYLFFGEKNIVHKHREGFVEVWKVIAFSS